MQYTFAKLIFLVNCCCIAASVLLYSPKAQSQASNFSFEYLSVKDGLSSGRVHSVLQDRQGFYWIAGTDGLNRFDGSAIKIFRHNRNEPGSIANNNCFSLTEGNDGDIWAATMNGVCRYQKKTGTFKKYFFHHPLLNGNIVNSTYGLAKDSEGNMWSVGYGLWKINIGTDSTKGFWYSRQQGSLSDGSSITALGYDSARNGLWMRTDSAINFFDIATEQFFHHRHNPKKWAVFDMKDKRPFFAVSKGTVWIYNRKTKRLLLFQNMDKAVKEVPLSFPNAISNFSIDDEGNPVFSFELLPAVIYYSHTNETGTFITNATDTASGFTGIVSRMYKDNAGNKWLSTGNGLYIIKNDAALFQPFLLGNDKAGFHHTVYSFVKQQNNLWLEIRGNLYQYNLLQKKLLAEKSYAAKAPRVLYNAGDSLLWLGFKIVRDQVDFFQKHLRR